MRQTAGEKQTFLMHAKSHRMISGSMVRWVVAVLSRRSYNAVFLVNSRWKGNVALRIKWSVH